MDGLVAEEVAAEGAGRRRRRSWRYGLLVAVLALTAAVLAHAVLTAFTELRRLQDTQQAAEEALAAARSYAPDLMSYDYRTVEEDLARALGHTTGELAERYRRLQTTLAAQARRQRAVQQATVLAAAVESATPDRVRVLLVLDTELVKGAGDGAEREQRLVQSRARMVLVRGESGWRVQDLSTLLGTAPAV